MSQYFLSILEEEDRQVSEDITIRGVLLKQPTQLSQKDLPVLKNKIQPHVGRWRELLAKRYIRGNRPPEWVNTLRQNTGHDIIDTIVLDIVGRENVYGEKPSTSWGRASLACRLVGWSLLAGASWALATKHVMATVLLLLTACVMLLVGRTTAMRDTLTKYGLQ